MPKLTLLCLILLSSVSFATEPCGPKLDDVELIEIEVKHLLPDLGILPAGVTDALENGRAHDQITRRGLVLQDYLPVTPEALIEVFAAMDEAGVPFGAVDAREALGRPNAVREIRFMTKSILINDRPVLIRQVALKAAGGVRVDQIESPESISPTQSTRLAKVFARFAPRAIDSVRKIYFEMTQPFGAVEVDVFLSAAGVNEAPIFINGEIEFHGARALAEAEAWRIDDKNRPPYFGLDLTDLAGYKSRDIASRGVPALAATALTPHQPRNHSFVIEVGRAMRRWADPLVADQVLGPRAP